MHYIRLLRPVHVASTSDASVHCCKVLLTITTDLGDNFYAPSNPFPLSFVVDHDDGSTSVDDIDGKHLWEAGMRVMSLQLRIRVVNLFQGSVMLHIFATSQPWDPPHAEGATVSNPILSFWSHGLQEPRPQTELIIPCHYRLEKADPEYNLYRHLPLPHINLLIWEDLGESIARHMWDAGLITASFISDMCTQKEAISDIFPIASDKKHISVLELGCGVGVLGITIAAVLEQVAKTQGCEGPTIEVLLTDIKDAEDQAAANIASTGELFLRHAMQSTVKLAYESLDWDDGNQGIFGPLARRRWDFVVLSDCTYNVDSFAALVGTLSAVHRQNCRMAGFVVKTRVLLATKPRHPSEESLVEFLEQQGWQYRVVKSIPIIRDHAEDDVVYIYMLEKGPVSSSSPPAKRGAPGQPTEVVVTMGEANLDASPTEPALPSPAKSATPGRSLEEATKGGEAGMDAPPTGLAPYSLAKRKTPGPLTEGATPGDEAKVATSRTKKARASKRRSLQGITRS